MTQKFSKLLLCWDYKHFIYLKTNQILFFY